MRRGDGCWAGSSIREMIHQRDGVDVGWEILPCRYQDGPSAPYRVNGDMAMNEG